MQFRAARSLKEWKHLVRKTVTNSNKELPMFCWNNILVLCFFSVISHTTSFTICTLGDLRYLACLCSYAVGCCMSQSHVRQFITRKLRNRNGWYTYEHISWPQGTPSHLQSPQPFEEVLEGLERAAILPVKGKNVVEIAYNMMACYSHFSLFP